MNQPVPLIKQLLPNSLTFDMLLVEGGEYLRGGADEEADEYEKLVHRVKVSTFSLGVHV